MNRNTANPLKKRDPSTKAGVTKAPTTKNSSSIGSKEPRAVQSAASGLKRPSQQAKPAERHSFSAHNDSPGEFLNNAVYDYLLKMGMTKTVEAFKDEVHRLGPSRNEVDANVANQLLEAFDKGSRELFFSKWNKLVPLSKRQKDEECNKLEFYLHVHFMAYSLNAGKYKPGEALTNEEVISFKEYLDNNGRDLAQTTEFLQYYALPYVPNPAQHASFKHLFAKDWVVGLRNKLEAFLNGMPSGGQVSALHQMYQVYTNQVSKDGGNKNTVGNQSVDDYAKVIAQLEASNQDLMNILQEYNEKYGNLTREYQILQKNEEMARNHLFESHTKWMAFLKELLNVTNDLVSVVDSQSKGSQVGIRIIDELKKRVQKYDNFLNANLNDLFDQSQDISTFEKFSTSQDITPEHSSIMSIGYRPRPEERIVVTQPYVILNFEKIKSYILGNSSNKLMQCSLLQALRWRITRFSKALRMIVIENRTRGASMRREVIISYSKSDVLDVRRQHPCILDALFINQTRQVCEFATRFINALTSDYYGRTYLLETDKIVSLLINLFIKEKGDTVIRRNCLGALQKLSLRKKPQLIMIEKDIIKWILHALKNEKDHLGEYFYEYATALLMNLSLRSSGKKKCEDSDIDVLGMLNDLLEHENMQVRSFVNGTLYSLLSNPLFKEQAQAMGMEEILKYLMENADERYKKQIHYIIQRLNSDVPDEDAQSDANDEDNDYDDMEDEDEVGEDDDIEDTIEDPNIMVGEDLLRQYFSLTGPEAQRQNSIIHEIMEETKSFKDTTLLRQHSDLGTPLNRPTTPLMLSKITQQQTGMSQIEGLHTPDEFRAKPRVLRTPNGPPEGGHYDFQRILPNTSERVSQELRPNRVDPVADNRQSFNDIQGFVPHTRISAEGLPHNEKEQPASDPNLPEAFNAKPRLLRTPPDNKQIKSNNFFNY